MPLFPEIPIPPDVLSVGLDVFTSEEGLRNWLSNSATWADGITPSELIESGRAVDVVNALKGISYGNHL